MDTRLHFDQPLLARTLFGEQNDHLRLVERLMNVAITSRGAELRLEGAEADVALARRLLTELYEVVRGGHDFGKGEIEYAARIVRQNGAASLRQVFLDAIYVSTKKKIIAPKSLAQKAYVDAIRTHDLVFGIGPAGTGKTYLAMAMAVAALTKREVSRVILTRPAVEAGEKLGFLPGDILEKVHPYLRPLYDALHDMMEAERASRLVERGVIEVAPLAFMRGRTLNDSFVILDEAQNTTTEQMKMFLTRLGYDSKAVVTGDVTQTDLPPGRTSGLVEVTEILTGLPGMAFVYFTEQDVVRHPLVQSIIKAYEKVMTGRAEGFRRRETAEALPTVPGDLPAVERHPPGEEEMGP